MMIFMSASTSPDGHNSLVQTNAFMFGIDGKKLNGNSGFQRDVVETALPCFHTLACSFRCDRKIEIICGLSQLTELIRERSMARAFYRDATDAPKKKNRAAKRTTLFSLRNRLSVRWSGYRVRRVGNLCYSCGEQRKSSTCRAPER